MRVGASRQWAADIVYGWFVGTLAGGLALMVASKVLGFDWQPLLQGSSVPSAGAGVAWMRYQRRKYEPAAVE